MASRRQRALRGLLTLIHASGEKLESRIRLQKEAFLLAAKGSASFDLEEFSFHHHGPYSRPLSELLQTTVTSGLVAEAKEQFDSDTVRYSYRLTDAGREVLRDVAGEDKDVLDLTPKLNRCNWRALELAATVAFLERKSGAQDRKLAFEQALKIKPACKNYYNEAEGVLQTVGL